jgi:hypothetical protein
MAVGSDFKKTININKCRKIDKNARGVFPELPESQENTSVHERLAGAVGHPSRVSRKGKAGPLEAGRGKYSPPENPERVTAGASERRDGGVLLQRSKKERLSRDYENPWSESPETPGVFVQGFRSSGRGLLCTSKIEIPGNSEKEL